MSKCDQCVTDKFECHFCPDMEYYCYDDEDK